MMRRLLYFVRKALGSIRHGIGLSLLTSGTIAASLLILALYAMLLQNLEGIALIWGRSATMTAYIKDSVPSSQWQRIGADVRGHRGVLKAELITPEKALQQFRARGPEAAALVEGVDNSILPAAIEIHFDEEHTDLQHVEALAKKLSEQKTISDVDYGQEEFARLLALLNLLRLGGLIGIVLIGLATAFIVANTIKLTVYARRDEIGILRLVGATDWFVRTPFLVEGALWGLAGGILGAILLWLADLFLSPRISLAIADILGGLEVQLFAFSVGMGMILFGLVLGVLGSGLAVRRFLEGEVE